MAQRTQELLAYEWALQQGQLVYLQWRAARDTEGEATLLLQLDGRRAQLQEEARRLGLPRPALACTEAECRALWVRLIRGQTRARK